jgi:GH24 family phage-related lysozyme (muramidase)/murein DD-endopeptidase MepM/ murein hydrolase activator NlpD
MNKGVKSIEGPSTIKAGVWTNYEVAHYHSNTPVAKQNEAAVTWEVYECINGQPGKKSLTKSIGKFRFSEAGIGKKFIITAFVYQPNFKAASSKIVTIVPAKEKKIESIKLTDINDKPFTNPLRYGQKLNVHLVTTSMVNDIVWIGLYEDDQNGAGHNSNNIKVDEKSIKIDPKGKGFHQFTLKPNFKKLANALLAKGDKNEGKTHEYYVTAYAIDRNIPGNTTSDNLLVVNEDLKEETVNNAIKKPEEKKTNVTTTTVTVKVDTPIIDKPTNTTITTVAPSKVDVEAILDAYFAKEEFTVKTNEAAGEHTYKFINANNNINKDKIAGIISKNIEAALKAEKKYVKIEDIKAALTKNSYAKNETIFFGKYKLGANFVKINSAPLEEEVFVVAKCVKLEGKEVTINIKEKEAILVAANANTPVIEAKENGAQLTDLKAKVENGVAKIKIKLRPKTDEDLKTWKEKLQGIKDGTFTYTFAGTNDASDTTKKKNIAGIIINKIKSQLTAAKKFAKTEDITKVLEKNSYVAGDKITFEIYKFVTEYFWLQAKVQGDTKDHDKEFLKNEGSYFEIKNGKSIIFPYLIKPQNDKENKWGTDYYWAAAQRQNMTTFNSNRSGGRRHAGVDLYSNPLTEVVAICDGEVLDIAEFYDSTDQVTVKHKTKDGREFIIRYGELDKKSITVKKGDTVIQKQILGKTGFLLNPSTGGARLTLNNTVVYMLHFEYYTGAEGLDVTKSLSNSTPPFKRRADLADPIEILKEGYRNTFEERVQSGQESRTEVSKLSLSQKGKDFIKSWEGFRSDAYDDSEGYCTIGYGHLIAKSKCKDITLPEEFKNGITKEKATELFDTRLKTFEDSVKRDIKVPLYQYEYDAIVSLVFNTGPNFLNTGGRGGKETKIKQNINNKLYHEAIDEAADVTNGGTAGLVRRRNAEIKMFKNNVYENN